MELKIRRVKKGESVGVGVLLCWCVQGRVYRRPEREEEAVGKLV